MTASVSTRLQDSFCEGLLDVEDGREVTSGRTLARIITGDRSIELIASLRLNGITRLLTRRTTTNGTELVMRRQRLPTVPTRLPDTIRGVLSLNEPGFAEDVLRVLGPSNVLVRIPHVRVQRPVHAMLNLATRVPLANHPRHGSVPERMRPHRLLNTSTVRDTTQLLTHRVRVNTTIVTPAPLPSRPPRRLNLMEQSRTRLVRPRMRRPHVTPKHTRRINQRILSNRRPLQPTRILVRDIGRRVREVNILHAQRERQTQTRARIRQELDKRHVTFVASRLRQRRQITRRQNIISRNRGLLDRRPVDVRRPHHTLRVSNEQQDRVLVGVNRRVSQIVLVAEVKDKLMERVFSQLYERRTSALTRDTHTPQVRLQRRDGDSAVLLLEPALDNWPVSIEDGITLGEPTAFLLESVTELLGVIDRHACLVKMARYYKLPISRTTSSISSEVAEANPAPNSPASRSTVGGVAA